MSPDTVRTRNVERVRSSEVWVKISSKQSGVDFSVRELLCEIEYLFSKGRVEHFGLKIVLHCLFFEKVIVLFLEKPLFKS